MSNSEELNILAAKEVETEKILASLKTQIQQLLKKINIDFEIAPSLGSISTRNCETLTNHLGGMFLDVDVNHDRGATYSASVRSNLLYTNACNGGSKNTGPQEYIWLQSEEGRTSHSLRLCLKSKALEVFKANTGHMSAEDKAALCNSPEDFTTWLLSHLPENAAFHISFGVGVRSDPQGLQTFIKKFTVTEFVSFRNFESMASTATAPTKERRRKFVQGSDDEEGDTKPKETELFVQKLFPANETVLHVDAARCLLRFAENPGEGLLGLQLPKPCLRDIFYAIRERARHSDSNNLFVAGCLADQRLGMPDDAMATRNMSDESDDIRRRQLLQEYAKKQLGSRQGSGRTRQHGVLVGDFADLVVTFYAPAPLAAQMLGAHGELDGYIDRVWRHLPLPFEKMPRTRFISDNPTPADRAVFAKALEDAMTLPPRDEDVPDKGEAEVRAQREATVNLVMELLQGFAPLLLNGRSKFEEGDLETVLDALCSMADPDLRPYVRNTLAYYIKRTTFEKKKLADERVKVAKMMANSYHRYQRVDPRKGIWMPDPDTLDAMLDFRAMVKEEEDQKS